MDNDEKMIQKIIEMLTKAEADRKAFQEKMDADRKAYQEKMAANKEDFLARMIEKSRETNQELLTKMKEDLLTKMKEDRKADHEDLLASMEKRMTMLEAQQKRMMVSLGQTEANTEKIDPRMMQSPEEHQDVPSEDVVVKPVKGLKMRRRGRKCTAGRRGEPKELNRGNCGSRRKLAAACRKVSRYATVAWRKRKLFRKSETRGYCDSRKGVTVADRRTSRHATVARRKRKLTRNIQLEETHESLKDVAVNRMRTISNYL
jgi:hypothetical protein